MAGMLMRVKRRNQCVILKIYSSC